MASTKRGVTLPELMIVVVIASIVAIGFSSVLMYTRNMYRDSTIRTQLSQDAYILDRYVRKNLTLQLADSLRIFASKSDAQSGITSSSGMIMRSVRPDFTIDYLEVDDGTLIWSIDSVSHYPIDSEVYHIAFNTRNGYSKTILTLSVDLVAASDSLSLEWLVSIRN